MDGMPADPVTCPLCGAVVSSKPDPVRARDVRALRQHLQAACLGAPPAQP